jgi:hypothetical protein
VERFQIARVENPRNGEEKSSHDAAMMIAAPQNMVPRFESGGDYSIKNENASASGRPVLPWLAFLATFLLAMSSRVLVFGSRFTRAMGGRR